MFSAHAAAVNRHAARVEHGQVDPAEVACIRGGTDDRANAVGHKVQLPNRRSQTIRIGFPLPRLRFERQSQAAVFDMLVRLVEKGGVGSVAKGMLSPRSELGSARSSADANILQRR